MPSRKKERGKARKAQAAAAAGVPQDRSLCTHGFTPPDKNNPFWACYEAFERELSRLEREEPRFEHNPAMGGMFTVIQVVDHTCKEIWTSCTQEKMKACLLAKAVGSLKTFEQKKLDIAIAWMGAVLLLENWDGTSCLNDIMHNSAPFHQLKQKNRDAFQGCPRSMFRFVAKRLSCSCLDESCSKLKQAMPKVGICWYCQEIKDRSKITLMVCGSCKIRQYCSARCQKLDWPSHKKECRYWTDLLTKN